MMLTFRYVETINVGERTAGAEIIGKRSTAKRVYFTVRADATGHEYEYYQPKYSRMSVETPSARVSLTDGSRVEIDQDLLTAKRFRGLDAYGNWVVVDNDGHEGYAYALTPCCHATAKGSMGAIVCRSCYEEIDCYFGGSATVAPGKAISPSTG